jgi:hypothetical protein
LLEIDSSDSFGSYRDCWHGVDEVHTNSCAYDLIRVEVSFPLQEVSVEKADEVPDWGPQTMKHIYSFRDSTRKVEEL